MAKGAGRVKVYSGRPIMPPESRLSWLCVLVEPAGGQTSAVGWAATAAVIRFHRPRLGWGQRGQSEAWWCYTSQLFDTDKFDKKKIPYEFYHWFGRDLSVHGVVEKEMGALQCTLQGDVQARALEVPLWMFDRVTVGASSEASASRLGSV